MYLPARRPRRSGFTLLEILVVVGILAILTALVASGIGKVRNGQLSRNTEGTVTKLQQALDLQWKGVIDQCKQDSLGGGSSANYKTLKSICGNDNDLTQALWVYLNLKREFPQSFAEATTAITFTDPAGSGSSVTLQPRKTFASLAGASTTNASTPGGLTCPKDIDTVHAEAAVLLFLILSEKGNNGVNFATDDATKGAQTTFGNVKVFADAWGTPISFIRHADSSISSEIGQAPYAHAQAQSQAEKLAGITPTPDPLDPLGKLTKWPFTLNAFNVINQNVPIPSGGVNFGVSKLATVISAGPDTIFAATADFDDIYGYRYRRQGNK